VLRLSSHRETCEKNGCGQCKVAATGWEGRTKQLGTWGGERRKHRVVLHKFVAADLTSIEKRSRAGA
jgi:hypothetical protein